MRLVVVVLGLVVLLVVAEFLGHLHRSEHVAHDAGESLLVVELVEQAVDIGAGLLLDPVAPQIDDALAALRRGAPGQPLAHHQRHGFLDRRIGLVAHIGKVGLDELVLEHGAEIFGDALHGAGADRFDACLLDGVVDGACLLALGRQLGVDAHVVAGPPERHGIAEPAGDRDVVARRLLRKVGQPRAVPRQRRLVLGESDLQLVVAGDRAHADADGALEIVRLAVAARFAA